MKNITFPKTVGAGGLIILALPVEFQIIADNVNEEDEVFQLDLRAADSSDVGINFSTQPTSQGLIENDDG